MNLPTFWFNYIVSLYAANHAHDKFVSFPISKLAILERLRRNNNNNKQSKNFMYTVWKGEVLMPCYHSIELNEILHDMCKDTYCQL